MDRVVMELEIALESQEISEGGKEIYDYEEMAKTAEPPLNYRSKAELRMLLSKGVLLNRGKTWFSLDMKGAHYEMISVVECLIPKPSKDYELSTKHNSRFKVGSYTPCDKKFKAHSQTQLLSPQNTYTVNLVFKCPWNRKNPSNKPLRVDLKYRLGGETKFSIVYLADWREDGWFMTELFSLFVDTSMVDLEIEFVETRYLMAIEGIEFQPMDNVEHAVLEDKNVNISDSGIDWEQKLPNDYEDIIKWIKDCPPWTTKENSTLFFAKAS